MYRVLFSLILSFNSLVPAVEDGWFPLFNGIDLSGWEANVEPESFSVEDGILKARCTSKEVRSHLFFVGDGAESFVRFKNFELRVIAKGEPNSNSGIFFHSDFATRDQRLHLANGYEVQLNSSESEKRKTGSLYAIVDVLEPATDDTEWFESHIIVKDKRIIVNIEGRRVIDYTEPDDPPRPPNREGRLLNPSGGAIALQAHDPESTWYFREILIRRLPD